MLRKLNLYIWYFNCSRHTIYSWHEILSHVTLKRDPWIIYRKYTPWQVISGQYPDSRNEKILRQWKYVYYSFSIVNCFVSLKYIFQLINFKFKVNDVLVTSNMATA